MVAQGSDPKAIHKKEQVNKYAHLKNATFSEITQAWRDHKTLRIVIVAILESVRLVNLPLNFGIYV